MQPFADNEVLKVLVLAILVAAAISSLAPALRERVVGGFETASKIVFGVIRIIMWAAPLGAFGGMAYTVAQFGGGALQHLGTAAGSRSGARPRSSCSSCSASSRG